MIPPRGRALLDAIAIPESGGRYDVRFDGSSTGARITDFNDHPRILEPIPEGFAAAGKKSSAAGRYQFVRGTWDEAAKAVGAEDFSPDNQDKAAWWLAQRDYRARTGRELMADLEAGEFSRVRSALAPTWEGLGRMSDQQFAEAASNTMTDANPLRDMARAELERRGKPADQPSLADLARAELERRGLSAEPEEQPAQRRSTGTLDSFTQGLALGWGDELTALESAVLGREPGGGTFDLGNYDEPFWTRYRQALDAERSQQAQFREDNKALSTVAEIGGAVAAAIATGGATATGTATTTAGRMTNAAIVGGATGGAYGAGDAEGGIIDVAEGTAIGTATGMAGGVAGERLFTLGGRLLGRVFGTQGYRQFVRDGKLTDRGRAYLRRNNVDPDTLGDDFVRQWEARMVQATGATDETVRMTQADEFSLPLTRGQATGNEKAIAFEQAARNNARGTAAASVARDIESGQRGAIRQTIDDIAGGADDALTAADDVTAAFQRERAAGQGRYRAAYGAAEDVDAAIDTRAFGPLVDKIRLSVEEVTLTPSGKTTEAATRLRNLVERVQRGPQMGGATTGEATQTGVSFQAVEQYRKWLNNAIGDAEPAARRELMAVKTSLDDWIDGVVDDRLIYGSDEALTAIKRARDEYSKFSSLFGRPNRPRNEVERTLARMAEVDVTPQEVANWLFGASKVGAKGSSVRLAARLEKILPEDAWRSVRGGVWRRLTQSTAEDGTSLGPQALSSKIKTFLRGDGRELASRLYTEQERARMMRFAQALDLLVPPSTATNPSRSGYEMARAVQDMTQAAAGMMGFGTAGPVGGIGAVLLSGLGRSVTSTVRAAGMPARTPRLPAGTPTLRGTAVVGGATAARDLPETDRRTGRR